MKITLLSLMICLNPAVLEVDGVSLETSLNSENRSLKLAGATGFTYALLFDVLSGGIYLPPEVPASQFSIAKDKALVLAYKRNFSATELREVTTNLFTRNNPESLVTQFKTELSQFNALYQDIKPGDRYQLTLVSNRGIELSLNGKRVGQIENPEFGAAVFNIWFGEKPFSASFRDGLLKGI